MTIEYFAPLPPGEELDFDGLLQWLGQQTVSFQKVITGSLQAGQELSSSNFVSGTSGWQIDGDGNAEFNVVTLRGDLYSTNWDGAIPADLSSGPDATATLGYYLDASAGAAQFTGNVYFTPPSSGTPGVGASISLGDGWSIRVYQDNPTSGEDALWIHNTAGDGVDHLVIGPGAGAEYLKKIRLKGDSFLVEGDGQERLLIASSALGGNVTFKDHSGNAILTYTASTDTWTMDGAKLQIRNAAGSQVFGEFDASGITFSEVLDFGGIAASSSRQVIDFGEGYSVYADNTGSGADNTRLWINTPDTGQVVIGPRAGDEDLDNILVRSKTIDFDDGSTGAVEVWPKGTLITMGYASSTTDIANVGSAEEELSATIQSVACDHASQPIYVDIEVQVVWRNLSYSTLVGVRPGVSGTGVGVQVIDGPGTADTDATAASGNASHQHPLGIYHSTSHSGSTSSGTAPHTHSHSHSTRQTRLEMSARWVGEATADGSGNIALSIFGDGDGAMDIDSWSISYVIWRR